MPMSERKVLTRGSVDIAIDSPEVTVMTSSGAIMDGEIAQGGQTGIYIYVDAKQVQ